MHKNFNGDESYSRIPGITLDAGSWNRIGQVKDNGEEEFIRTHEKYERFLKLHKKP